MEVDGDDRGSSIFLKRFMALEKSRDATSTKKFRTVCKLKQFSEVFSKLKKVSWFLLVLNAERRILMGFGVTVCLLQLRVMLYGADKKFVEIKNKN